MTTLVINNTDINNEAFDYGIQHFNNGKDILDIPVGIAEADIETFKDGYYYALDQDVLASGDGSDVIFNTPTQDDDEVVEIAEGIWADEKPIGQEVFDELFDSISAIQEEEAY
jgi:hypothetical protein